eukprot:391834-Ditylum_brightwellii.AAC.1
MGNHQYYLPQQIVVCTVAAQQDFSVPHASMEKGLRQKVLMDQYIFKAKEHLSHIKVGFQNASGEPTPAEIAELPADSKGSGPQEHWSYSSVIGMLLYLAANTCPDIAIAAQKAVKRTVHYLINTQDSRPNKGIRGM